MEDNNKPVVQNEIENDKLQEKVLVEDEFLITLYKEILAEIREDRFEIDQLLSNFVEMVINGGDGSSASKEALVNLMAMKNNIADKKTRIADLMTGMRFREKAQQAKQATITNQTNNINIADRRTFLAALDKYNKKKSVIDVEVKEEEKKS